MESIKLMIMVIVIKLFIKSQNYIKHFKILFSSQVFPKTLVLMLQMFYALFSFMSMFHVVREKTLQIHQTSFVSFHYVIIISQRKIVKKIKSLLEGNKNNL